MTKLFTVEKNIVRVRPLTLEDFVVEDWYIPTLESIKESSGVTVYASRTLTLKTEVLADLLETWEAGKLWQDWNLSAGENAGKLHWAAHTSRIKMDFRGCKDAGKTRKAKDAYLEILVEIKDKGDALTLALVDKINEQFKRKVDDRNRWIIQSAIDQFTKNLSGYPKIEELPNRKSYVEELERLREVIKQKRIELQKLDRQYILGIWQGKDGAEYPAEIREPVIARLQEDLAKLDKGEEIIRGFGLHE